jgi:pyrophosphatase PpaX
MTGPAPPSAVLFDLDGTLIATRRLYLESFADALEPVLGRRPGHDWLMERRPRAEVRFLSEVGGPEAHPQVMERFYEAYERRHDQDFEGVYPGVDDLLSGLRREGLPTGIVTGKSRRAWGITSPRVALGEFALHVFDDDVPAPKPDPAGLGRALSDLRVRPEEVLYVGDSPTDLEAARAAGVLPVAALWPKKEEEVAPFRSLARSLGGIVVSAPAKLTALLDLDGPRPNEA